MVTVASFWLGTAGFAVVTAVHGAATVGVVALVVPTGQMGLFTVEQFSVPLPVPAATPPQVAEMILAASPVNSSVTEAWTL
jgi:hypothetical protein